MTQKAITALEVKKGDFTFTFLMPGGSTYGQAFDAAFEVFAHVNRLKNEAVEKVKADKEAQDKKDEAQKVAE